MLEKMISDEMWELLDAFSDKEAGPTNIVDISMRTVPPIVKKIGLHQLSLKVDVAKDPVHGRNKYDYTIYNDGIEGKIHLNKVFNTKVNGVVEMFATADTEEAAKDFEKFAKLLFTLCGRVMTLDTLDNTVMTDMLTGASNIIGFHKKAGGYCKDGGIDDYAIFYTNIKNFKFVNQKIGMQNGDDILRLYVKRFRDNFGDTENGIFRLGADSFVLLIKKDQVPDLIQMLKTFDIVLPSGIVMHVYFRTGIFLAYKGCTSIDLMNFSSAAYAAAKSGAGDFVFFEQKMLDEELKTKNIMVSFPEALKKKEFQVYYQPKVSSDGSKLVGAEALCRWLKDGEVISPLDFIPIIEKFGSITHLDLYVVERVCSDLKGWLDSGIQPVRISVNISRRDLSVLDLAQRICSIADKYSIPHELLEVELTETFKSDEFSKMLKLIAALRDHGFKISVDDFGSGYSTLTMLKDIKADIIKLDRAFIKDMTANSITDKIILRNVVNMVNELNIDVIAEGVESREQADFLRETGCNVIQGFYFDKPLPKEEFDKRLTDKDFYLNR